MIQVDERAVEAISDAGAARASAARVIWAEHDVVRKQHRAPSEELRERLLAVFGVEHVLLLDWDPGELETLLLYFFVPLCLLRLELGKFVTRRLPFPVAS